MTQSSQKPSERKRSSSSKSKQRSASADARAPQTDDAASPAPGSDERGSDDRAEFETAYAGYARALNEASASDEAERCWHEASQQYAAVVADTPDPSTVAERHADSHRAYAEALRAVTLGTQRPEEAYGELLSRLSQVWGVEEAQDRSTTAHRAFVTAVQKSLAPAELSERASDAYRSYVRSVQEAVARIEPETLDVDTLEAAGQSLIAAARMTRAAQVAIAQRRAVSAAIALEDGS